MIIKGQVRGDAILSVDRDVAHDCLLDCLAEHPAAPPAAQPLQERGARRRQTLQCLLTWPHQRQLIGATVQQHNSSGQIRMGACNLTAKLSRAALIRQKSLRAGTRF
jgi:hypothetical protein